MESSEAPDFSVLFRQDKQPKASKLVTKSEGHTSAQANLHSSHKQRKVGLQTQQSVKLQPHSAISLPHPAKKRAASTVATQPNKKQKQNVASTVQAIPTIGLPGRPTEAQKKKHKALGEVNAEPVGQKNINRQSKWQETAIRRGAERQLPNSQPKTQEHRHGHLQGAQQRPEQDGGPQQSSQLVNSGQSQQTQLQLASKPRYKLQDGKLKKHKGHLQQPKGFDASQVQLPAEYHSERDKVKRKGVSVNQGHNEGATTAADFSKRIDSKQTKQPPRRVQQRVPLQQESARDVAAQLLQQFTSHAKGGNQEVKEQDGAKPKDHLVQSSRQPHHQSKLQSASEDSHHHAHSPLNKQSHFEKPVGLDVHSKLQHAQPTKHTQLAHQQPAHKQRKSSREPTQVSKPHRTSSKSAWPFPTDYNDHFETSSQALLDLQPVLERLAQLLGRTKQNLRIYDPYYCQGSIRKHYLKLGFSIFIHENRDFYKDVDNGTVPDYDVLVTNPPYSEDHKEKILDFCIQSGKPWALLMPNYVAIKQYYTEQLQVLARKLPISSQPFYIVPKVKYAYEHPEGTGHEESPFESLWYVHLGKHTDAVRQWMVHTVGPSSLTAKQNPHKREQGQGGCQSVRVAANVAELRQGSHVPTMKRPNPKQRKKMKQRMGLV